MTENYAEDLKERGGDIHLNFEVCHFECLPESNSAVDINRYPVSLTSTKGQVSKILICRVLHVKLVSLRPFE